VHGRAAYRHGHAARGLSPDEGVDGGNTQPTEGGMQQERDVRGGNGNATRKLMKRLPPLPTHMAIVTLDKARIELDMSDYPPQLHTDEQDNQADAQVHDHDS
jgi:hypothetical protein